MPTHLSQYLGVCFVSPAANQPGSWAVGHSICRITGSKPKHLQSQAPAVLPASWGPRNWGIWGQATRKFHARCMRHMTHHFKSLVQDGAHVRCTSDDSTLTCTHIRYIHMWYTILGQPDPYNGQEGQLDAWLAQFWTLINSKLLRWLGLGSASSVHCVRWYELCSMTIRLEHH